MSEKQLISAQLARLTRKYSNKVWTYKIPDPSRCPKCGTLAIASKRPFDVMAVLRGEPLAIEFKTRSVGDLSAHQMAHLTLFDLAGGTSLVVVGSDVHVVSHGEIYKPPQSLIDLFK